jgi:NitT/TauT family transport system substrate-binding protein
VSDLLARRTFRNAAGAALLSLAVLSPSIAAAQAPAPQKLTVRFTWKLKGEYAPLFVALDKGYYKAEGLDIDLAEGSGAQTVFKLMASGAEKIGYGPAIAAGQAVSTGLPIKVVAVYQNKSPMGVIAFPNVPLKTPKDLEGKSIGISVGETFGEMLKPFTVTNGVDFDKIDVMSVYLSNELPQLEKRTGVAFNVLKVTDFGMNVLGASLIVSNEFAAKEPDTVRKLLRATAKGYEDAMKDPAAAALTMAKYMKVPELPDVLQKQVEATVLSTNAPAGKPIGWQSEDDWKSNLQLLKETGAITEVKPLTDYYTNAFAN